MSTMRTRGSQKQHITDNDNNDSATDTDSDGERIRQRQPVRKLREKARTNQKQSEVKPAGKKGRLGGVTLKELVAAGVLHAGKGRLTIEYKSRVIQADLRADGMIVYEYKGSELFFESPSAFSITVKRHVNPSRKADDGWKSVKFDGHYLEVYKKRYLDSLASQPGRGSASGTRNNTRTTGATSSTFLDHEEDSSPATKSAKLNHIPPAMCQDKRPHSNFSPSKIAQDVQAQPFPWNRLEVVNGSNIPQSLGTIRTFENGKQPFATEISSAAAMMMDVHAHLNGDNISGLLAGHWDSNSRHLRIEQAHPVRMASGQSDASVPGMNVEDIEVVQARIATKNLSCIGWYCSHPNTSPHPSREDIETQKHRQAGDDVGIPQIGAIVSPSSISATHSKSEMVFFQVNAEDQALAFKYTETCNFADDIYTQELRTDIFKKAAYMCSTSGRPAKLLEPWRRGVTKEEKLLNAVAARIPEHWVEIQKQSFLDAFKGCIDCFLKLDDPKDREAKEAEVELSESSDPKSKTDDRLLTSNGDSHMLSAPSNGRNVLLDQSQINRQLNNVPQRNFLGIFKPVDADGSSTESDSRPPYSRANSADGAQVPSSPLKTMFDSDNEALATLNDVESVARVGDIQHSTLGRPT